MKLFEINKLVAYINEYNESNTEIHNVEQIHNGSFEMTDLNGCTWTDNLDHVKCFEVYIK